MEGQGRKESNMWCNGVVDAWGKRRGIVNAQMYMYVNVWNTEGEEIGVEEWKN